MLEENEIPISSNQKISKIFSDYFPSIVQKVLGKLLSYIGDCKKEGSVRVTVRTIIEDYSSIMKIKEINLYNPRISYLYKSY